MLVGQDLRLYRDAAGLTQEELLTVRARIAPI